MIAQIREKNRRSTSVEARTDTTSGHEARPYGDRGSAPAQNLIMSSFVSVTLLLMRAALARCQAV